MFFCSTQATFLALRNEIISAHFYSSHKEGHHFFLFSWFVESHQHLLNPLPANSRYQEVNGALIISSVNDEDKGNYR